MKAVIAPVARQDILSQLFYLIDENVPHVAERFVDAIEVTILRVRENPQIGALKELENPRLKGLRQWPVKGFEMVQIYYLVEANTLRVVRILHGRRNINRILLQ